MRFNRSLYLASVLFPMALFGRRAEAQSTSDSAAYARAQEMVSNGEAEAGRHIVDSLINAAPAGSAQYAEGLYWRATLAASGNAAEKDYRRIVVDHPLSNRVPGALLRMGELESARGDRAAALQHFQRLTVEHPESPLHAEASYWLARTYFETNDVSHGCVANTEALALVPAANVELKNRIAFQQQRCRGVVVAQNGADATAQTGASSAKNSSATASGSPTITSPESPQESTAVAPVRPTPPAKAAPEPAVTRATTNETTKKTTTARTRAVARPGRKVPTRAAKHPAPAAPAHAAPSTPDLGAPTAATRAGTFAVQVAAFGSRSQAEELAVKLRGRGFSAHVDGVVAPYRVRIGSYSSRPVAVAELQRLKAKQISGFVTPE